MCVRTEYRDEKPSMYTHTYDNVLTTGVHTYSHDTSAPAGRASSLAIRERASPKGEREESGFANALALGLTILRQAFTKESCEKTISFSATLEDKLFILWFFFSCENREMPLQYKNGRRSFHENMIYAERES